MPAVDPATVAALLDDNVDHAPTAVAVITTMAKAYTRGNGFVVNVPNGDIEAVIITAAPRLAGNASQASQRHRRCVHPRPSVVLHRMDVGRADGVEPLHEAGAVRPGREQGPPIASGI